MTASTLHKWKLRFNSECPCGNQNQTMDHILFECTEGPHCTDQDLRDCTDAAQAWITHWRDKGTYVSYSSSSCSKPSLLVSCCGACWFPYVVVVIEVVVVIVVVMVVAVVEVIVVILIVVVVLI
ncbi:hypothetical protein ElyMa_002348100 [Elysia marginata]|uniref:SRCR domain-containing protein n=1 Tax=Elysia marginata TaxID=1093978 RepID=A0AAV4G8B1_9GAST|nr:hypothetical protein ElyMa_002348100 [Elysia marginata]